MDENWLSIPFCSGDAWYIEHKNLLGSCPEYLLIDALTPVRKGDANEPSVSWKDYEDRSGLPADLLARVASITDLINP